MSATCTRAHEFGQPLRWIEIGVSSWGATSPRRFSRSSTSSPARFLVSTNASLQNSRPVQAIVARRNTDGRAGSPRWSSAVVRVSSCSPGTSSTRIFWYGVSRTRVDPTSSAAFATPTSVEPLVRPAGGATPTYFLPSTWSWIADVVDGPGDRVGRRAVDERAVQVLVLQHLAELLGAPVGDEELDAGAGAQPAVAVVAEHLDDALPDVGDLVERHPRAQPHRELRVGGQAAADVDVEARPVLGVHDADEADVVDLVRHVLLARDRGLELAGEVRERPVADEALDDLVDGRRAVDHLVGADPRHRRAEHDARAVAAGLGRVEVHGLEPAPESPACPRRGSSAAGCSRGR